MFSLFSSPQQKRQNAAAGSKIRDRVIGFDIGEIRKKNRIHSEAESFLLLDQLQSVRLQFLKRFIFIDQDFRQFIRSFLRQTAE